MRNRVVLFLVLITVAYFGGAALHEYGHVLQARKYGWKICDVTYFPPWKAHILLVGDLGGKPEMWDAVTVAAYGVFTAVLSVLLFRPSAKEIRERGMREMRDTDSKITQCGK